MILLHQRLATAIAGHLTNVAPMLIQRVVMMAQQQLTQHSVYVGYFAAIAIGVTISSPWSKRPLYPIRWSYCEIMLGHRLRRWANIILTKTF